MSANWSLKNKICRKEVDRTSIGYRSRPPKRCCHLGVPARVGRRLPSLRLIAVFIFLSRQGVMNYTELRHLSREKRLQVRWRGGLKDVHPALLWAEYVICFCS